MSNFAPDLYNSHKVKLYRTDDAARTEEVIRVYQLGVLDDEALMALV